MKTIDCECEGCGKLYAVNLDGIETKKANFICKSCGHKTIIDTSAVSAQKTDDFIDWQDNSNSLPADSSAKIGMANNLKIQINALIACLVVIVMGGYAGFMQITTKATMKNKLEYLADTTAQRLSKHLKEPFWALDDSILKESLAAEMLNRQIYAINILDRDGKAIYMGNKRNNDWQAIDNKTSIGGNYTARRVDIIRGEDKIGAVEIYLTDKFLNAEFKRSMITVGVAVIILIVTIVLFVSFIFQKMIIRPITTLTALADRISTGDLDIQIPLQSKNEIGQLSRSFDRMKKSVQISLQAFNTNG